MSSVRKRFVEEACRNWRSLTDVITQLNEEEVIYALELENEREKPRPTVMRRLNQRLARIKTDEVLEELRNG